MEQHQYSCTPFKMWKNLRGQNIKKKHLGFKTSLGLKIWKKKLCGSQWLRNAKINFKIFLRCVQKSHLYISQFKMNFVFEPNLPQENS